MKELPDVCLEIENHLPLWVGGDLEPAAERAVEDHLACCVRCAALAARARAARASLSAGLAAEARSMGPGPELWPGIRAALRAEGMVGSAPAMPSMRPAPLRPARSAPSWRAAVAIPIAAAVLVGLFLARGWLTSAPLTSDPSAETAQQSPASVPESVRSDPGPFVAQPVGLRPHVPGEPRLRDSARQFDTFPSPAGRPQSPTEDVGQPAAGRVERLNGVPPR